MPEEQMPPVLIVDLAKGYGGAEVRVLNIAGSLHGRYSYAVAALAGSPLHRRLEAAKLVSLPVPFSRRDPRLVLFLWHAIRRNGYRIVDAHNVQSQFWGHLAAALAAATKVSTVHSAYKLEHRGSARGWLYEQVLRFNTWWGGQFIVVSEAVYAYLQSIGIPPDRISLIHNSIQLPAQPPVERDLSFRKSLGWPEDTYVVVVVARLEPVKGHRFLIEALSRLATERPQLRCLIVGDGRTRAALEAQVEESKLQDRIQFTGFRDDIPAFLNAGDAFCLPSLSEGLPYALLEACAHGLPLLVTRVGGMAALLTHCQTAYLAPPSDSSALAEGLRWLMDHPQEAAAMGRAGYNLVRQKFNLDEMIAKTLAVYH
jgi:glycosyltransferase involved in cell wall biosynthesis